MYFYLLTVLWLTIANGSTSPAPQQTSPQGSPNTPSQVDPGPDVSFPSIEPVPGVRGSENLVFSSTPYTIQFSSYPRSAMPQLQNFPTALLFVQRLVKDDTFRENPSELSVQTDVRLPIDYRTLDVHFQFNGSYAEKLSYNLFSDLLAHVGYYMLKGSGDVDFKLLDGGNANKTAFSGSVRSLF